MANYIDIKSGFNVQTASAIDKRLLLTKAEMLTAETTYLLPNKYFCICLDDGKIYLFDNDSTPSAETGHYHLLDKTIYENTSLFESALNASQSFTQLVEKVGDAEQGTGIAGQVKELQEDVAELETDVATLDEQVEVLKAEVEDPESGLAKKIQLLEGRLDTAEERMTEIEKRISEIKLDNIAGTISGELITE